MKGLSVFFFVNLAIEEMGCNRLVLLCNSVNVNFLGKELGRMKYIFGALFKLVSVKQPFL